MATLTIQDYGEIRKEFYRFGFGKEELQVLAHLPNSQEFLAAMQSVENHMVTNFASLKAGMETELGDTLTNPLTKKLLAAYFRWKIRELLGV